MRLVRPSETPGTRSRTGALPWDETTNIEPPDREWRPNRILSVRLACGCTVLPWPLIRRGKVRESWCDPHGWQVISRKKLRRYKRTESEYGYQTRLL